MLLAMLLRLAFLSIEGKLLLFFGHECYYSHQQGKQDLTYRKILICRIYDKYKCLFITLSFNLMILYLCNSIEINVMQR